VSRKRVLRLLGTVVVTGLAGAYLLWKIDLGKTADILAATSVPWFLLSVFIMVVTILPMAWRWQLLLAAKGIRDSLHWLTRAYFVSYLAGQVLPTSVGGDAVRIFETAKRHPGNPGLIAGTVVLERALGGVATLALAAVGFVLAIGRYDVGAYLWLEGLFVLGTIFLAVLFFSQAARPLLRRASPLLDRLWVGKPLRALYEGIHTYRDNGRLMAGVLGITLFMQATRILAIWATAKAVGVDLSPRPYYVMGPLLFLVMLVPFTLNGFAVREAFFISFLGNLGVDADSAFATGFLFFLVSLVMSVPGAGYLAWESVRGPLKRPRVRHG
jgi:uncharacterized protein (TIRG00374 family)